ncbi:MAG: hypothetical protein BWY76_03046 [bacterium ADurb.Bin429]|nr:MAG: hypothetical protein BWY76_03046 [bacterium ADurb.Bin429]
MHDVFDDFRAAPVFKVAVNIRHGGAIQGEKALEPEPVIQRVQVADVGQVGDDGAGAGAADADEDILFARPIEEVTHDQEVGGEAFFTDNPQLIIQAFLCALGARRVVRVNGVQPRFTHLAQHAVPRGAFWNRELWQLWLIEGNRHVTEVGDMRGVLQRLHVIREDGKHLLGAFQVLLGGVIHLALAMFLQRFLRADADEHLVGVEILAQQIMGVIGDHQRDAEFGGDTAQNRVHLRLLGVEDALRRVVVLQLQIESVRAEEILIPAAERFRAFDVAGGDDLGDFTAQTRGKGDDAFCVSREQLVVYARGVVESLQAGAAGELQQIAIAGLIARQQHHVAGVRAAITLFQAAVLADIGLHADDGFDPGFLAGAIKLNGGVHVAVVGDGDGGHAEFGGAFGDVFHPARAIKQAVFRV